MADPILNTLSLCSGVGWLDLGWRLGLAHHGIHARSVGYCERDAYAAAVLLARMEDAALEPAPVWCGDIAALACDRFRGQVDAIIAGLPCQPYSPAGKGEGNQDQRAWGNGDGPVPHALRIIGECSPAVVWFENVPAWVTGGHFRSVGEELCRLGYTLEEPLFVTAAQVRASHERERVFVLAYTDVFRRWAQGYRGLKDRTHSNGFAMGDSKHGPQRNRISRIEVGEKIEEWWRMFRPADSGRVLGHATGAGSQGAGLLSRSAARRQPRTAGRDWGVFAPGPGDPRWEQLVAESPHLVPAVEPGFRVLADGCALVVDESRADQLRCSGNGVVVLQAATAAVELVGRVIGA